jgi:hypothetical protein
LGLCLLAGCWQEVHYSGAIKLPPRDVSEKGAASDSEFASDASGFGDELAAVLAAQPTPLIPYESKREPIDVSPIAGPSSVVGERYRMPPSQSSDAALEEQLFGVLGESQADRTEPGTGAASPAERPTESPVPAVSTPSETAAGPVELTSERVGQGSISNGAVTADTASTRRAAFKLGSEWSLAALARERGAAADDVNKWIAHAQELAQSLGTSLNPLPPSAGGDRDAATRAMIRHLVVEGQRLGRDLAERHGADHAALLELGVKSNLLLVHYEPNTPVAETLAASIAQARELAQSPAALWQPLLDAIAQGREPAVVRQIVLRLPDEMDRSLAAGAER